MPSVLLHVDPGRGERDDFTTWAADLVEAITAASDDAQATVDTRVAVVADVLSCLEIGVVTMGRSHARTVEGGERAASLVKLFPFMPRDEEQSTEAVVAAYQALAELANTGAVEGILGRNEQYDVPPSPVILRQALEQEPWESIVTLGGSPDSQRVIRQWAVERRRVSIVQPSISDELGERVAALLRRAQTEEEEDNLTPRRRHAVYQALQLESMLLKLEYGR